MDVNNNIDFSKCKPLMSLYGRHLMEYYDYDYNYYDYENSYLFDNIEKHFVITEVRKVNNPQLYGMYLLHKEELQNTYGSYVEEKMLYHATSPKNAKSITKNNLNWRKTTRSRYGNGVCFANNPHYANKHASSGGAFIIAKVITNNIQEVGVCYDRKIPDAKEYDTTATCHGTVVVKYDDYSFYPEFVVFYDYYY